MKNLFLILILAVPIFSQVDNLELINEDKLVSESSSLQADLELINQIYCAQDQLYLYYRLKYRNLGENHTILHRNSDKRLSSVISNYGQDGKLQVVSKEIPELFVRESGLFQKYDGSTNNFDQKYFVMLAPGESYEINDLVFTLYYPQFPNGAYFLQIEFVTFPLSFAEFSILQKSWRNIGTIWYKSALTPPMKFSIGREKNKDVNECRFVEKIPITRCHVTIEGKKTCE